MSFNWDQADEDMFALDPTVLEFQPCSQEPAGSDPTLEALLSSTASDEFSYPALEPWTWPGNWTTSSGLSEREVDPGQADNKHANVDNSTVVEVMNATIARLESVEAQGRNFHLMQEEIRNIRTALKEGTFTNLRRELNAELIEKTEALKQWYGKVKEEVDRIEALKQWYGEVKKDVERLEALKNGTAR